MGAFFLWTPPGGGSAYTLSFDVVTSENPSFPNTITEHTVEDGPDIADNIRVGLRSVTLEVFITNEPIQLANQWDQGSGDVNQLSMTSPGAYSQPVPSGAPLTAQQWFSLPIGVPLIGALAQGAETITFAPNIGINPTLGISFSPKVLQFSSQFDAPQLTHDALEYLRTTQQNITVYGTKGTYENMFIESFSMTRSADEGSGASFTIQLKEVRIVSTSTVPAPTPTKPRGNASSAKGSSQPSPVQTGAEASALYNVLSSLFPSASVPAPDTNQ